MRYFFTSVLIIFLTGCASNPSMKEQTSNNLIERAKNGDLIAQSQLGFDYQYGTNGISKDAKKAFKWNQIAAKRGEANAQHNLAVMYDEGIDIPENNNEAVKWYQKASQQGLFRAKVNLGICYWKGEGVKKNYKKAWKLLNDVRLSSNNKQEKWAARRALDAIKQELGITGSPYYYPENI